MTICKAEIRRKKDDICTTLERAGVLDRLPMEPRIAMQTHLLRQRRRSGLIALETVRIHEALAAAGIRCVTLKGAGLALTVYRQPEHRFMGDLDLLVAPLDVDRAMEVLLQLGYDNPWSAAAVRGYRAFHYHLPLAHHDGQMIELHWDLVKPGRRYKLDAAGVMERAVAVDAAGASLWIPSLEDQMLHAAIQQLQDGYTFLARSVDLDRLIRSDAPDWELLQQRAIEGNLGTALAYALQLAHWTMQTPIASSTVGSLAPGYIARAHLSMLRPVRSALEQRFVGHPAASKLLRLWLSQGARRRAQLLADLIFEIHDHEPMFQPWALEQDRPRGSRRRGLWEAIKLVALQAATYAHTSLAVLTQSGRNQMRFWSSH